MLDINNIKASISTLIATNEQLLVAMRELSKSVETKDSAIEDFVNNTLSLGPQGNNTTNLSNVDLDTAKNVYEQIRIMHKKVKENTVAIKKLVFKLKPFVLPGAEIHDFNTDLLLYRRFIRSGSIVSLFANTSFLQNNLSNISNNISSINITSVEIPIYIETISNTSENIDVNAESMEFIKKIVPGIYKNNLEVIVRIIPRVVGEQGDISNIWNPLDKETWFANFEREIIKIINVLNDLRVSTLIIGSNLIFLEQQAYEDKWASILSNIKEKFYGILTYSTTMSDIGGKIDNKLFRNLDFLSISDFTLPSDLANIDIFRTSYQKSVLLLCSDSNISTQESYFSKIQDTFKNTPWMLGVIIKDLLDPGSYDLKLSNAAKEVIKNFDFVR